MPFCVKCKKEADRTHSCEHTEDQEFCVECYTELHYYMTEPK